MIIDACKKEIQTLVALNNQLRTQIREIVKANITSCEVSIIQQDLCEVSTQTETTPHVSVDTQIEATTHVSIETQTDTTRHVSIETQTETTTHVSIESQTETTTHLSMETQTNTDSEYL